MSSKKAVKSALESILFIWGEPLDVKTAAEVFNSATIRQTADS